MGVYDRYILPRLIDRACGTRPFARQRQKVVPQARGTVVEIGIGSGLNLPHYDPNHVERLIAIEPDDAIWAKAKQRVDACPFPVERLGLSGENLPLDDACADTVVVTYALCTIPDPVQALREMARVLKPGGEILFTEHGLAPDAGVSRWQRRIEPLWKPLAGGCHLSRDIPALFEPAGLKLARLEQLYLPGPKVFGYNYWGAATHMGDMSE